MKKKTFIISMALMICVVFAGAAYIGYQYVPSVRKFVDCKVLNKTDEPESSKQAMPEIKTEYTSLFEPEHVINEKENYEFLFLDTDNLEQFDLSKEGYLSDQDISEHGLYDLKSDNAKDTKEYILYVGETDEINDLIYNLQNGKVLCINGELIAKATLDAQNESKNEQAEDLKKNTTVKVVDVYIEGNDDSTAGKGINLNRYNGLNCGAGAQLFLKDNGHNGQRHEVTGSELQPYDLLYYNFGTYDHNAVYLGDGVMFECGIQPDSHCAVSPLRTDYESVWRE